MSIERYTGQQPVDLMFEVEKQMMGMGVKLTEIDRFIEGSTNELAQLAASDDPDHWLNFRPW